MLPDIPPIRDSLAALSFEESGHTSPGTAEIVICDKIDRQHSDGSLLEDRLMIVLKQTESAPIKLSALSSESPTNSIRLVIHMLPREPCSETRWHQSSLRKQLSFASHRGRKP